MGKLYLIAGAILLGLVVFIFVTPFLISYAHYVSGLKGLKAGARITYYGRLILAASGTASMSKAVNMQVMLGFKLTIERGSGDGFTATLTAYNITHVGPKTVIGRKVFERSVKLRRSDPLLEFLFPNSTRVELSSYGYEVRICPHPSPYVLANRGLPSDLGVPRYYVGALVIRGGGIVVTSAFNDTYPRECWECFPPRDTGTFFNYVRISKGFMLVDYQACYGGFMCGVTNKTIMKYFLKHGSPLLNMLADDFGFKYLRRVLSELREIQAKYSIYPDMASESITLGKTNVVPTDQQWLAGIEGLYMTATPFSQAMTVAAVVLLALYFRRR